MKVLPVSLQSTVRLLVFDLGGVFRDSSLAMYEGLKRGFNAADLEFNYDSKELWNLRGIGKYNLSKNLIKVMIAINNQNENLKEILKEKEEISI